VIKNYGKIEAVSVDFLGYQLGFDTRQNTFYPATRD
jgi:hypothetical protein